MNALAPITTPAELLQALRVDGASAETRPEWRDDELRSRAARAPRWPLVALAAAAGVAVSLLLVPRAVPPAERDRQPVLARLQTQVEAGDRSPGTMIALAREQQRVGNLPEGLAVLQDVVAHHPRHAPAWQALADMLRDAGRSVDALAALERAQRLAPTPERERLIAARRQDLAPSPVAAPSPALPKLPGVQGPTAAQDHMRRAEQLLASGSPKEAQALLDEFVRAQPSAVDARFVGLQMNVIMALPAPQPARGKRVAAPGPDAAAAHAITWLDQRPRTAPDEALQLSTVLTRGSHHEQAARVLEPWLAHGNGNLVAVWAQAMRSAGLGEAAMVRLARLGAVQAAGEVVRQRVRLAIEAGKFEAALDAMRSHGIDQTPPDVLAAFVHATSRDARQASTWRAPLREIWSRAGVRLKEHDLQAAARAASAAGDAPFAADLADAALPSCEGKPDCAVQLAMLNHQLGRGVEARQALASVDSVIDDALLLDFARLSVLHGYTAGALARLERQRRAAPNPSSDAAWALVATAAGKQGEVLRWLEASSADAVPAAVVRELFDTAVRAKSHALAVATGLRLEPRSVRPADRVMLAQAMMDSGRTAEALAQWRTIRSATSSYDEAYASALRVALSRGIGSEARDEYARSRLAALRKLPPGDLTTREAVVRQLMDLGANDEVLPTVEALALSEPARWLAPFESLARQQGRDERLPKVWRRLATHPSTSAEQRLHVADALAAVGQASASEPALRVLAADAGVDDPIAKRLIALWGPTLSIDQVDWVEARVARAARARPGASDDEIAQRRADWMRVLNERGRAARTIALFKRLRPRPTDGPVFDAYVEALQRTGGTAAMARARAGTP
jgi:tetratricopeptide (TPR) repeat protein